MNFRPERPEPFVALDLVTTPEIAGKRGEDPEGPSGWQSLDPEPKPISLQTSEEKAEMSRSGRSASRLVPLAVLVLLSATALGMFMVTRNVVVDQEQRLLKERAAEVVALVSNSFGSLESSLRIIGQVGASPDRVAAPLFTETATGMLNPSTVTVGVAASRGDGFVVVNTVGAGPGTGEPLLGERAELAARALREGTMVSAIITDETATHLVLALPVGSADAVAYQDSIIAPQTPVPSSPESPFHEVRVVLYASSQPEPSKLVVTTEADLPLTGNVEQVPFSVGGDEWLLVISPRSAMVGSFALAVPGYLLAGGLLMAILAAAVAETLRRRRGYALALVGKRTRELEHALEDRRRADDARRLAQEAAETANRAKSAFLSRMSHELRTPLNSVLGFGQLLDVEELTPSQADSVDHIMKAGRHLLDLMNEVLDISRIEAGELALSPEPVLVSELIQNAVNLIKPAAQQRGIQVLVDRSGVCDCYVFADKQRAKQILLNLLSNAVKYNRVQGTIALTCQQPTETRVSISVADTGHGIAHERLGLLFIPFERLGAESSDVEGTGIGLALSRRLAEAMGGSLQATSTLGQGSTFSVELPRVEGPVERYERLSPPVAAAAATTNRGYRVLHIEDNLSNIKLVERIFEQRPDVEVIAAMHGGLGLELAREHDPALILLDLHLPDIDGDAVLQRLRDDPVTASIPVVIVSADATSGQIQRLLAAGATAYMTKPIDVRELLSVFEKAITGT